MAGTGECMQGPGAMLVCAPSQAVASWQVASALLRTLLHQPAMDRTWLSCRPALLPWVPLRRAPRCCRRNSSGSPEPGLCRAAQAEAGCSPAAAACTRRQPAAAAAAASARLAVARRAAAHRPASLAWGSAHLRTYRVPAACGAILGIEWRRWQNRRTCAAAYAVCATFMRFAVLPCLPVSALLCL